MFWKWNRIAKHSTLLKYMRSKPCSELVLIIHCFMVWNYLFILAFLRDVRKQFLYQGYFMCCIGHKKVITSYETSFLVHALLYSL